MVPTTGVRRAMSRQVAAIATGVATGVAAVALSVVPAEPAQAATINLDNCSNSGFDVLALWDAIVRANNEAEYPGPDTISLAPGCTYTLRTTYPNTSYTLPPITSAVTIVGRNATLRVRPPEADEFYGIFDVRPGASLTLTDTALLSWRGYSRGSYFTNAGAVLVTDTTFDGNKDPIAGPAIVNRAGASFTLLSSEMSEIHHTSARGAAIHNEGTMYVVDSDVRDNNVMNAPPGYPQLGRPVTNKGHMELINSYVRVTEVATANNVLLAGGIDNEGYLLVRGSQISGHRYKNPGAGIHNSGTLVAEQSTFFSNVPAETLGLGGAVYNSGDASFLNTTFWGNYAPPSGGALYNAGRATITHATFVVSDIRNDDSAGFTTLAGSILERCVGTIIDGGSNLATGASSGCPGTVGNPSLTQWPYPRTGKGHVFRLGAGSAAIDAAAAGSCPASDQRDVTRPRGAGCDIGAYENQAPASPTSLVLSQGDDPGNTGDIGLDWADASDADHDALTYRLYHRDFDDPSEMLHSSGTTSGASLTSLAEGTHQFRVDAFDGNHASLSSASRSVVVDKTPPSSPSAAPDRSPEFTESGGTGWYRDRVDVTFGGSTDPLLSDGSRPSGVSSVTPVQSLQTSGAHTLNGTATDAAGNVSPPTTATFHVDSDAPVVSFASCPASVLLGSSTHLSWSASDAHSGLATAASGSIAVDTSTVGSRTLTVAATDNVGHDATATCTVDVIYDFTGFFAPVDNPPDLNRAQAGKIVSISYSLGGDQGLGVIEAGYPASAPIACDSADMLTSGAPTDSTPTGLAYAGRRYIYQWKTDKSWAGTCRQFIMLLDDGTYHRANFAFN